ncbi:MAG: hypothetical protein MZV64_18315 [Ignavibacteriales bacterium]|nr:hypothetical protein [Ignavibacteriales bacterium]
MPSLAEYWIDLGRRLAHHVQAPPGRPLPQRPRAHGRGRQVFARAAGQGPARQHLLPVLHPQGRRGREPTGRAWPAMSPASAPSIQSTFEILWTRPFGSVGLYLLGMHYCKVLPKDLLESQGRGFFNKPIGTGPFKFAEWIRSPRLEILGVRLERNAGLLRRAQALSLGRRVQPPLHGRPVRRGQRPPGHGVVGAPAAPPLPGPGERHPEVLLPGPQLRRPASRPAGGPPGHGPGARQGPTGRGLRHALGTSTSHWTTTFRPCCPGYLPAGRRAGRRSRVGQAPARPPAGGRAGPAG